MKPPTNIPYAVSFWLKDFGTTTEIIVARDALDAAQRVLAGICNKYAGADVVITTIKAATGEVK